MNNKIKTKRFWKGKAIKHKETMRLLKCTEEYRIPILKIQHCLYGINNTPEYKKLELFCKRNLTPNFGKFKIEFYLERSWFPIVVTDDRYLANILMKKYAK